MKKTFGVIIFALVIVSLGLVSAGSGAIWTTAGDCGDEKQDVNQYSLGDGIYINGKGFSPGEYQWAIKGLPGKASCDPDIEFASGTYTVDESGAFCFDAYTVKEDDCGEYSVDFGKKKDNYRVEIMTPVVPEFGIVAGILTLASAVGIFFFVRRK